MSKPKENSGCCLFAMFWHLLLSPVYVVIFPFFLIKYYLIDIPKKKEYETSDEYLAELERKEREAENRLVENKRLANSYKNRKNQKEFVESLVKADDLINLTPIEFEKWVMNNIFSKEGWVCMETKVTGDGGVDIELQMGDEHSIVQCKRYRDTVGEPALRDFYGTMISKGVSRGYFVTTGLFSKAALNFADNKPIYLIDRRLIAQKYIV